LDLSAGELTPTQSLSSKQIRVAERQAVLLAFSKLPQSSTTNPTAVRPADYTAVRKESIDASCFCPLLS
jgi:hypothetical protein